MRESVENLLQAITKGDAIETEKTFATAMAEKLGPMLDAHRAEVAQSMFKVQQEEEVEIEEGWYEKPASAYRRKGDEIGGGSPTNFSDPNSRASLALAKKNKAYKTTKKPINGHPTNVKEEAVVEENSSEQVKTTDQETEVKPE